MSVLTRSFTKSFGVSSLRNFSSSTKLYQYKYVNNSLQKSDFKSIVDENANALFGTELLRGKFLNFKISSYKFLKNCSFQ